EPRPGARRGSWTAPWRLSLALGCPHARCWKGDPTGQVSHGDGRDMTHAVDQRHDEQPRAGRSGRATWLRRVGLFALSLVCARIIFDLVGVIDWDAVWNGIAHLNAWQLALLVG